MNERRKRQVRDGSRGRTAGSVLGSGTSRQGDRAVPGGRNTVPREGACGPERFERDPGAGAEASQICEETG